MYFLDNIKKDYNLKALDVDLDCVRKTKYGIQATFTVFTESIFWVSFFIEQDTINFSGPPTPEKLTNQDKAILKLIEDYKEELDQRIRWRIKYNHQ